MTDPRARSDASPGADATAQRPATAGGHAALCSPTAAPPSPTLAVAVCITTFRRPDGLKRLLASLDTLTFTRVARPEITVFVIDNDADRPLSEAHPDLKRWTKVPLEYRIETQRGLAHARNAALAAVDARFDAIAFIDDDEWAEPQWLDALLATRAQSGAMVIQGPVRPEFSRPPEPWMKAVGFYEVGPFEDGAELDWGASGNCLIDNRLLDAGGVRFDTSFNHSGGEDSDLFARLLRSGQRIVAARDAVAYETVPEARMQLSWALRRGYRLGHTLGRLALSTPGAQPKLRRFGKAMARLGFGCLQVFPMGVISRSTLAQGLINVSWSLGTIASFAGRQVAVYNDSVKKA